MDGLGAPPGEAAYRRSAGFELDPEGRYVAFDAHHRAALLARGLPGPRAGAPLDEAFAAPATASSAAVTVRRALEEARRTGSSSCVLDGPSPLPLRLVRVDDPDGAATSIVGAHPIERHGSFEPVTPPRDELARLADGVLNELNNLGVGLGGAMEGVRTDASGGSALAELLDDVRGRAEIARRLARVIRSATMPRPATRVACDPFLGDLEPRLRQAAEPAGIALDLNADGAALRADPDELGDALVELVRNASEASARRVVVRTRLTEGSPAGEPHVAIEIEDDGEGVAPDRAAKVLDAFVGSRKNGQGIGLTRARAVARAHLGCLSVSPRPDAGTVARMLLPVETASAPETAAADEPKSSLDIFVVDDAPEVRRVLERVLRHAGHTVSQAEDGIDALEKLEAREGLPDLVVLDLMMPRMDGVETYRALRARAPELPILITSGYHPSSLGFLSTDGRASFLPKPFSPSEVITALDALMRGA